jgi:hypothetical protein
MDTEPKPYTVVYSTKAQLEEFKESLPWQDVVRELNAWAKGFEIERGQIVDDAKHDNPSTACVLMHMGDINGRVKTVEYIKLLPDMLLKILEDQIEAEKQEKE